MLALLIALSGPALTSKSYATDPNDVSPGSLVRLMKSLEEKLGFHDTGSFEGETNKAAADYRCYYTGKLDLPDDYEWLRLKRGNAEGCRLNPSKYDVFFYPLQAMASSKTQLTTSLAHSSPERVLMVIPHEDFHQDPELKGLPGPLIEAAATLVGFLTARDAARQQFGTQSEVYRNLSREAELFLKKSSLTNRYFEEARRLYGDYGARKISQGETLAAKARLFAAVERQCEAIEPKPRSFSRCLAVNNNAGLAFDHTYTLYYPLVYGLAQAQGGGDLKATIDALKQAMAGKPAEEAIQALRSGAGGTEPPPGSNH